MKLVIITGPIASGKSTFEDILKLQLSSMCGLEYEFLDADSLAKQILRRGSQAYHRIVDFFGNSVLNPDETLKRNTLFETICFDNRKHKKLNSFVHPHVRNYVVQKIKNRFNNLDYLFYTVPHIRQDFLLDFLDLAVDIIVVAISTKDSIRFHRLIKRKMDPILIRRIMKAQDDFSPVLSTADYIINANATLVNLKVQVAGFVAGLQKKKHNNFNKERLGG